jgi:anhydro-N-acetylmuramic acid kinase
LIVAGIMSGTSADGVDVALVRLMGAGTHLSYELLGHHHFEYPKPVRKAVLRAMNASAISVAELSRLNFRLAEFYAEAVQQARRKTRVSNLDLVGCHGQTIYHQGHAESYLGKKTACTWQTGEGSIVAARLGVPVVSDFRPADMAAGGKGAPLVPLLDFLVFRSSMYGRIVQNIGGIANLTAIPPQARPEDVLAFDTGPGNMVIDQLVQLLYKRPYDRDGAAASKGKVIKAVLQEALAAKYFRQKPPKTAGREEFGHDYTRQFLRLCGGAAKADIIATATALTAGSIAQAVQRFVLPRTPEKFGRLIVSGGGSKNQTLMKMLQANLKELGIQLRYSERYGLPSQAKEAMAFALLAYESWHHRPGNLPSATGAKRPAILGKIAYV